MRLSNALELVNVAPQLSELQMSEQPRGAVRTAFGLVLAAEYFEQVIDDDHKSLAGSFCEAVFSFYELFRGDQLEVDEAALFNLSEVRTRLQHLETVFGVLEGVEHRFSDYNWRAQIAWRNVEDYYEALRFVLAKKCNALFNH